MKNLKKIDPEIYAAVIAESARQQDTLQLIPSENHTSRAVMEALGTDLTNKYSEGYPKKRYYQGNKNADVAELLAIERAKKLFVVPHVNVQPYSGSPANTAVYFALLSPGDTILGLSMAYGGHLTHGAQVSFSGKYFNAVQYGLDKNGRLDYIEIEKLAKKHKPKIIVVGTTAYPGTLDFKKFAKIADSVNAHLHADISHIAGLVVAGAHPDPVPHVHTIMTTTHKTLRGPRGAMLMVTEKGLARDPEIGAKIDKAVFPGLQGGPHDNQTAAIAVALKEASTASYKKYGAQVVENAKVLAEELKKYGFTLIGNGTENHLLLIDLTNKGVNGAIAAYALEMAGIVTNKNSVPNDTMPPFYPSGIRIGTPAMTTRGMKGPQMKKVASWINRVVEEVGGNPLPKDNKARKAAYKEQRAKIGKNKTLKKIAVEIKTFAKKYPTP